MANYRVVELKASYNCDWKCVHCHQENSEKGTFSAESSVRYGVIGTQWDEVEWLATQNATDYIEEALSKFVARVNDRKRFDDDHLNVEGKCIL